ncbi:MAG: polyphosphate polymerase domain-containing protein [Bacilli bacterium]|nr:polyphosphate polymerase domain-containing protein [Bacilli bacterium]
MAKDELVFKRVEKKYVLNKKQLEKFLLEISSYIKKDNHDEYTIKNIYYDTDNYQLIRNSIDKPLYKEKLRIRCYDCFNNSENVYVEIKKKFNKTVIKRRVNLNYQEAISYLNKKIKPNNNSQILNEIDYFINFYELKPKIYLAYERIAFCGKDNPSLRITIDKNIRYRLNNYNINYDNDCDFLLDYNQYLIEIKTCTNFPLWLVKALNENELFPQSFSKYGNSYKQILKKGVAKPCS